MTPSAIFLVANTIAFFMWLLMIFLPKWKITERLIRLKVIPIGLSLLYAFYLITSFASGPSMDFGSLQAIMQLFTVENAVLAGWLHYLAFDMIVGMWMLDENKKLHLHQLIMLPCLLFTFMMGPVGLLLFLGVKALKK